LISVIESRCIVSEELLGLIEYYSCILSNTELLRKECEFRSKKLGLVLDFIRAIVIPENLERELTTAIIKSWRLQVPETTLIHREIEHRKMMGSINSIKDVIGWMERYAIPINSLQLNFKVLSNLPMVPSDLMSEDAPRIYDLISQIMNYCATLTEEVISHRQSASSP